MSKSIWKGESYAILKAMRASGNQQGLIASWKAGFEQWVEANPANPDAMAAKAWLPYWRLRPFYTAEELAPIWPALAIAVGYTNRWPTVVKSPKRLSHELQALGFENRVIDGKRYFFVERIHYWRKASDKEIRNALATENG